MFDASQPWQGPDIVFAAVLFAVSCAAFLAGFFARDGRVRMRLQARAWSRSRRLQAQASPDSPAFAEAQANGADEAEEEDPPEAVMPMSRVRRAKRERDSGVTPPYEFDCALARIEINGFADGFAAGPVEAFMADVNAFFDELAAIVARYGGYLHEIAGHEAIFYFKNEDDAFSSAAAMSALRDAHAAADRIAALSLRDRGRSFHTTSAVALGRLRYGKQGRGFAIAGTPLIETAQILALTAERPDCRAYFGKAVAHAASAVCESIAVGVGVGSSRGGADDRALFRYSSHRPLAVVLDSPDRETWSLIRYFRSDDHIVHLLRGLREGADRMDAEKFSGIVASFREWRAERMSEECRKEYLALLEDLFKKSRAKADGNRYAVFLASAAMAARSLVPASAYDREMQAAFKALLRSDEKRVVANVLDLFAWFDPANDDVLFSHLLNHKNNRILANVLVKEAMRSLNKKVAKQLENMLESPNPYFVASGVWAVGEVADHYRKTDRVYFSSHVHLRHLIDRAIKMVGNPNEMVARQAQALESRLRENRKGAARRGARNASSSGDSESGGAMAA